MKNKSNLSFIVLFGIAFLMVIASCKKDKEDDNGQNNLENQFSVTLDYGGTYDYFWVVLCNLEGTEILDYKKLEGIGTADMISGVWAFYQSNETETIDVFWYVHGNYNLNKIRKPALPQEILDDIGDGINSLEPSSVYFSDYNTTSNFVDLVNRFTITDVPVNQNYDAYYRGSFSLNNNMHFNSNGTDIARQMYWDLDEWH
ncbi:MAG: hypothetical protein GXO89_16125 [Chlorobi bacterium]|nr:hypothetical protein [Chlorobiota bacterium]